MINFRTVVRPLRLRRAESGRAKAGSSKLMGVALASVLATVATVGALWVGSPAEAQAGTREFGYSSGASLVVLPQEEMIGELDAMVQSGASWLRLDITWRTVENRPGEFNWARVDNVVNEATARGLKILGLIGYAPTWARGPLPAFQGPPLDVETFGHFAEVAAARYSTTITDWEIWNEPNHPGFFSPCPDVPVYFGLLRSVYTAIHRVQPNAFVLAGGLASRPDGICSIAPKTFMDQLYALGGGAFLDGAAVHPYTWPQTVAEDTRGYWANVAAVRSSMEANGDAGKQIWLTEIGAPTGTAGVTDERQAEIVLSAIDAARALPYTGPTFIHGIRDRGVEPAAPEDNYGLVRRDFTPKPLFDQLVARSAMSGFGS